MHVKLMTALSSGLSSGFWWPFPPLLGMVTALLSLVVSLFPLHTFVNSLFIKPI